VIIGEFNFYIINCGKNQKRYSQILDMAIENQYICLAFSKNNEKKPLLLLDLTHA
jgi:hypothetical protein